MRELLVEQDWAKITLGDIAAHAGISRQTLYNEFGSRQGLARAYALRLADQLVDHVVVGVAEFEGDAREAFRAGLSNFILDIAIDPLVLSLISGAPKIDLLRLVTLDAGPLIEHASDRLSAALQTSWLRATAAEADVLAHAVVRIAVSYITAPASLHRDAPEELSLLLGPYVEVSMATRGAISPE
ncbi:TetR/AcrR family transcriptional regulator [Nocardia stercoris]|uniref:TetR/AcrR family transcriptional regulator n=2 Tax=Nocardia stercoris TaxID=2483361 RepID=A0A3M2LIB8_9NOCA|nr:TetR/AcrR family transcriptional regulator [Nocardia stercoris]